MTSKQTHSDASGSRRMAWMDWFGLIALGLLMVCSLVLLGQLLNLDMLDNKYLLLLMAGILILNSGHAVVQLPRRPSKGGHAAKIGCGVLAVILSAGMIYGAVAGGSLKSAVTRIVGKMAEKQTIDIIVLKDNEANSIEDAVGYTFGVLENADQENTAEVLKTLSDLNPTSKAYASVPQLADALYDGEVDAIILNDGYLPVLEQTEGYTDFDDYTRILKQFDFTKEVAPVVPNESITVEPFVVYCSGIDARNSDVNIQSLSDVNILAVVNPKSRQILLLNTPRDYFLPLSFNGQLDKLTHAGMYGIDESMRVLDDLYGVETQYYARVNFYGLTKIVDALGGVDVYSEQTFTTKVMQIPDKNGNLYDDYFSFTEGMNYNVDGQAALAFCRERYSFSDGDNQRGRNQMAM
ncbi:MAG: LCP family protein, partial [Oscillospiraceae bacterium]|nr:LCP family protein [Oscillospiraceae bacterium]